MPTETTFPTNAEYQKFRLGQGPSLLKDLHDTIEHYCEEQGTEIESTIRDVLTDLRHLCDIHGFDFAAIDRRAYEGYCEENSPEWRGL